ncbi:MAG: dTDP-4-dehydrorhamnose 3,5-epimerase [Planctomycetes bacterium]|nr:dTDP-4-dehydrorhamnose 3,5-epimerase [Planctomycetota bacterium]MDP6423347.1 dTDP-4-dehydrorhamnose 3,5-epimerase [Planctomycetota bacterium]
MMFQETDLPGVLLIEPRVHHDPRGFFLETYRASLYAEASIPTFVQDNHSRSARGTLRGLHANSTNPQGKLIRCVQGSIFDVAVDIRVGSPTFGKWAGVEISADNFRQIYMPEGFAHGFYVISDTAEVEYKCTRYYDPNGDLYIAWDDPDIGIDWQLTGEPLLSDRDKTAQRLAQQTDALPRFA